MRAHRGFTMLEMLVTIAIIGILAALAVPMVRSARRNASVTSAAFDLKLWLGGLRARALRDQNDLVAVVVDASDAAGCAHGNDTQCGHYFVLRPQPGFTLNGFDPDSPPFASAQHVDDEQLPRSIRFHRGADGWTAPNPFNAVTAFPAALVGTCGSRACVAVRFRGDGEVGAELPGGGSDAARPGLAFAIGSDIVGAGADHRAILVSFPTGIVRSYPLPP